MTGIATKIVDVPSIYPSVAERPSFTTHTLGVPSNDLHYELLLCCVMATDEIVALFKVSCRVNLIALKVEVSARLLAPE